MTADVRNLSTYTKVCQLLGLMRAGRAADDTVLNMPRNDKGLTEIMEVAEAILGDVLEEVEDLERKAGNGPLAEKPEE